MLFKDLGLSAELLRAVKSQGYSEATPIQSQAIPLVLEGHDVLAGAQTGTGKTAGFTLPVLQRLQGLGFATELPRALILTPTRELAAQVQQSVESYGKNLPFKSLTIFGGVSANVQIKHLRKGCDIIVATPGRLLDHLQQGNVDLSSVEMLVLDEADRMLDMGFIRDMRKIFKYLPAKRQTLLFSATFSKEIRKLASDLLTDPVEVQVTPENTTAEKVTQQVYAVEQRRKREFLSHRIGVEQWNQVLVFTRTKHGANRLATQLERDGISASAIHGNKSQSARTRALKEFKEGKVRVLVATDIAARGLDIKDLPYVVNFELPNVPEDYVHRIGRTARAGQDGHAISLVSKDERDYLRGIERLLGVKIEQEVPEGYEPGAGGGAEDDEPRRGKDGAARSDGRRSSGGRSSGNRGSGNRSSGNRNSGNRNKSRRKKSGQKSADSQGSSGQKTEQKAGKKTAKKSAKKSGKKTGNQNRNQSRGKAGQKPARNRKPGGGAGKRRRSSPSGNR